MPTPSQVTAININEALGYGSGSTNQLSLDYAQARNLANKPSPSSQISYGDCRWGINFPGYDNSNYLDGPNCNIRSSITNSLYTYLTAQSLLSLTSSGSYVVSMNYNVGPPISQTTTWLTSGVNSDYTVQMQTSSANFQAGYSALNVDLPLSSSQQWAVQAIFNNDIAPAEIYAIGNLIIKDSGGTTLFVRPVYLYAYAEGQFPL